MARLVINSDEFTKKLERFSFKCSECGSSAVTIDIDWAAYPSCSWLKIIAICDDCKSDETIYDIID